MWFARVSEVEVKEKLLQYLACPVCLGDFELQVDEKKETEIISGCLVCGSCSTIFPISNGIPRILPGKLSGLQEKTSRVFGEEWNFYPDYSGMAEAEFLDYIKPLQSEESFQDKIVLDAGCGNGDFARLMCEYGAKEVMAVDFSRSVEVANQKALGFSNYHVIQADINKLPFKAIFDYILLIGVVQHLPDPRREFADLIRKQLKKRGEVFIWVYGREGNRLYRLFFEPLRKHVTSRLPFNLNKAFSILPTSLLYGFLKLIVCRIDRFGLARRLPMKDYFDYFARCSYKRLWFNTLDKMVPPFQHLFLEDEIVGLFKNAGLIDLRLSQRNGNSWRGFGTKE